MNEKGFGLRDVLVFLAIVCLCILISMVIFKRTFNELFNSDNSYNSETYSSIEDDLERIGKTYTDNFIGKILEDGDNGVITIRDMQAENLLKVVRDIEDDNIICSGYVTYDKYDGIANYKAYLKCADNYITKGYRSSLDEPVKKR